MRIAIVGGGIGGLVTALQAVENGHDVVLFEKDKIGAGASGKALGVLVPVTGMDRPIDRLQRVGIAAWPELAQWIAAATHVDVEGFWRDWGDGRQQVRLPLLMEILKHAIEAKGGIVREGEAVAAPALLRDDFDVVILAAGLGNVALCGAPMKISAGVAGRFKGPLDRLVTADNLFVCPDWNGTVIAGSVNREMVDMDGIVPADMQDELIARVAQLVPDLEFKEAWIGYRPVEVPRLPLVRDVGGGVLAVVGLGKIGIGVSPMIWPEIKALLKD